MSVCSTHMGGSTNQKVTKSFRNYFCNHDRFKARNNLALNTCTAPCTDMYCIFW